MHANTNQRDGGGKMLTRQIAQRASSMVTFADQDVTIKHFDITLSDKPVLTFPILSPKSSSSCPEPTTYRERKLGKPKR